MLTATALEIWEWFKYESIYEQLYSNIMAMNAMKQSLPGLELPKISKIGLGVALAFAQIFLLICPFIFFGKYGSEKNKFQLVRLDIDLITGSSKNTLYSGLSARSIRDMDSGPYKDKFQTESTPDSIKGIPQNSLQIISFYEQSSTPFRITLDQLNKDLTDLVSALQPNSNVTVKLAVTFSYFQASQLKGTAAQRVEKQFRTEVVMDITQISKIVQMYSTLRNIGSQNPDRQPSILSSVSLPVVIGTLVKFPNVGNSAFFPSADQSYFNSTAYLSIQYTEQDFLLKSRDLRWALQALNPYSGRWGDKNSFYLIAIIDDSGSSLFSAITAGSTVGYRPNKDYCNVHDVYFRRRSVPSQGFQGSARSYLGADYPQGRTYHQAL